MDKFDGLLARVFAMEAMLTALALSCPDRAAARLHFAQARTQMEAALLPSASTEEFVQAVGAHLDQLYLLIAS